MFQRATYNLKKDSNECSEQFRKLNQVKYAWIGFQQIQRNHSYFGRK